jgi:hypothetical protein
MDIFKNIRSCCLSGLDLDPAKRPRSDQILFIRVGSGYGEKVRIRSDPDPKHVVQLYTSLVALDSVLFNFFCFDFRHRCR